VVILPLTLYTRFSLLKVKNKRIKKPHKGIRLSSGVWVKSREIKGVRDNTLLKQGQCCAISGVPLTTGALDHDHASGLIRGVLLSEVNMLEGRYLKLFSKLKLKEKYGIDFAEMLVSMGMYLKQDYSANPLHSKHMEDFRKKISRNTIPTINTMLISDFGIAIEGTKLDLVATYVQCWVDKLEE
jgi:hypothetical protein